MILKTPRTYPSMKRGTTISRITNLMTYIARGNVMTDAKGGPVVFTNSASRELADIANHMASWSTMSTSTHPIRHVVASLDPRDRPLNPAEWERIIALYIETREAEGALYFGMIHSPVQPNDPPQHLHLAYTTAKGVHQLVPTRFDSNIHRITSRRAEIELGLMPNLGQKYSGSDRKLQKERTSNRRSQSPTQ